jgi:hypothetical protein
LWHIAEAGGNPLVTFGSGQIASAQVYFAAARGNHADQRLQQRRFAHAVTAHHSNGFAGRQLEAEVVKNMAFAVEHVEVLDREHVQCPR